MAPKGSESEWRKTKASIENPGYTIIRQSVQSGTVGGIMRTGQDGIASTWIELNKQDLGAGGAGGSYDDTALWEETAKLQDEIDALDTAVQALPTTYATKKELTDAVAALQTQIDALDPSGGDPFDPAELEAEIAALQTAVEELQTALATEVQDRTDADDALSAAIDENTAAIAANTTDIETNTADIATNTAAIENIKSTGYDDTQIRKDFAEADAAIQAEVDQNKTDIQANTDAIEAIETYDDTDLAAAVADNTQAIADNAAAISANTTAIGDNTAVIQTNTDAIAEITENAGEVKDAVDENTAAVAALQTSKVSVEEGQGTLTIWRGTEAEYNLIADPLDNVLYVVTG